MRDDRFNKDKHLNAEKKKVQYNNNLSSSLPLEFGVPQGSILAIFDIQK